MLVNSVIILVGFRLRWPTERCQSKYIPWQTLLPVIIAGAGSIILLLRTYVIVSRSRKFLSKRGLNSGCAKWERARWVLYVLVPLLVAHLSASAFLAATHVGGETRIIYLSVVSPLIIALQHYDFQAV